MNAALLAICALAFFLIGYRFYGRFLSRSIFRLAADETVPSVEFQDGVDFVPTRKGVLWGHHFTSIASAAPIVGPAIAVIRGWVPELLWVVVGSCWLRTDVLCVASLRSQHRHQASIDQRCKCCSFARTVGLGRVKLKVQQVDDDLLLRILQVMTTDA